MSSSSQLSESLVKRLAGPSTGKAGLAKDQTEINRIIAEASKGSKFYQNEKRKDHDLTDRISRILKLRDEAVKGVDIDKIEMLVDQMLLDLESERDLSQIIVHCDMDAFFANVELLHDPTLKGKPFAVGGGVISTASYEARAFGVRSGMSAFIARKLCPELIILKSHYGWYSEMSDKVFTILRRYDPTLCVAGCDEGYLNITPYLKQHGLTPDVCVQEIRRAVCDATSLTVSAGIAPNKMLAKICSDKNKPNGQYHLPFDSGTIIAFMRDLPIRKVPGIGRVNERLLESVGIKTCGDVYTHRATISLLDKQFGLRFLLRTHLGIASNVVQPYRREERKSIGAERTFAPLDTKEAILQKLEEIAEELEKDMAENQWAGRTVTLKFKLDTYQGISGKCLTIQVTFYHDAVFTRAKSCSRWVTQKADLLAAGRELILPEFPLKIRLLGLRVTKLKDLKAAGATTGIKRFFDTVQNTSPNKKRRKSEPGHDHDDVIDLSVADDEHLHDDEVMPGFHEHDEEESPLSQLDMDDDNQPNREPVPSLKPVSMPAPPRPQLPASMFSMRAKPVSMGPSKQRTDASSSLHGQQPGSSVLQKHNSDSHPCPICGKVLVTDNQGLNEHIDFCLSKGAIREAQAEAASHSAAPGRLKPASQQSKSSRQKSKK